MFVFNDSYLWGGGLVCGKLGGWEVGRLGVRFVVGVVVVMGKGGGREGG